MKEFILGSLFIGIIIASVIALVVAFPWLIPAFIVLIVLRVWTTS